MAISFVNPTEMRRLDLSDGDWIDVRDRITYGAKQRLDSVSIRSMVQGDGPAKIDLDMSTFRIERMVAYIVGWSARKPDGSPVKPDRDSFAALSEQAAEEINEALDRHIEERSNEVKAAEGNPTPTPIEASYTLASGSVGPEPRY
jgi:hypothetical protein